MNSRIIDGKALAKKIRQEVSGCVATLPQPPGLAVILVGDNPASLIYVRNKVRACEETGIKSIRHHLPATTSQEELSALIEALNKDPAIDGILLQLPLPSHLDAASAILAIDPAKDVDGLHPINLGRLMSGLPGLAPCTPQGATALIKTVEKDLSGKHAVIIGRSLLFGKPMGQLLLAADCTVTQCHSKTRDLKALCQQADILVAAVGRPGLVKGEWVKENAIVIDVGINRLDDDSLTGDVAFDEVVNKARAITPVPGGVGPTTIAFLLKNTLQAAQARR